MNEKILLEKQKIESGFAVPDGFFENNKAMIMQQVIFEKKKPKSRLPWLSIAASFLIVVGSFVFWQRHESKQSVLVNQEIKDYLALQAATYFDLIDGQDLIEIEQNHADDLYDLSDNELEILITTNPTLLYN